MEGPYFSDVSGFHLALDTSKVHPFSDTELWRDVSIFNVLLYCDLKES